MNDLIKIDETTNTISARELWEKLGIKKHFTDWIQERIKKFNLIEGKDFFTFQGKSSGGRPGNEFGVTLQNASLICASENTDIGREFLSTIIDYISNPKPRKMEIPQDYPSALRALADEVEYNQLLSQKLIIAEPKAAQYDLFMNSKNSIPVGEVAKHLGIGRNKFFEYLRGIGMLNSDNIPYQEYVNRLYFEVVRKNIPTGETVPVTLITPKGMDFISKKINGSRI